MMKGAVRETVNGRHIKASFAAPAMKSFGFLKTHLTGCAAGQPEADRKGIIRRYTLLDHGSMLSDGGKNLLPALPRMNICAIGDL
jgi:hypothetical protein